MQVQRTIGRSDYVRRDLALKNLIQPLAGEYGMHNSQPQREWPARPARSAAHPPWPWPHALCSSSTLRCMHSRWHVSRPESVHHINFLCRREERTLRVTVPILYYCWCCGPGTRPSWCVCVSLHWPAVKTHRELFADFFKSLFGTDLEELIASSPRPASAELLWSQMSRDIMTGGGSSDAIEQVRRAAAWAYDSGHGSAAQGCHHRDCVMPPASMDWHRRGACHSGLVARLCSIHLQACDASTTGQRRVVAPALSDAFGIEPPCL